MHIRHRSKRRISRPDFLLPYGCFRHTRVAILLKETCARSACRKMGTWNFNPINAHIFPGL